MNLFCIKKKNYKKYEKMEKTFINSFLYYNIYFGTLVNMNMHIMSQEIATEIPKEYLYL